MGKELTWSEAIECAIIQSGYIATLKQIYQIAPTLKEFDGLTPNRTINERVQRDSRFVKIKPGLYALKQYLDNLPDELNPKVNKSKIDEDKITHSYVQGMLLEVGNSHGFKTFAPDKGSKFITQNLSDVMTLHEIPKFTFENILQSTRYIDVIWFNERNFPNSIFEIENSTNFRNSLVKFVELQDFTTSMYLIAPNEASKVAKYNQEIEKAAFSAIKDRVKFFNYDKVIGLYNSQIAVNQFKDFFA